MPSTRQIHKNSNVMSTLPFLYAVFPYTFFLFMHHKSIHASTRVTTTVFSSYNPTAASKEMLISAYAWMLHRWTYLKSAKNVSSLKANSWAKILARYGWRHFIYWTYFRLTISVLPSSWLCFFSSQKNWTKERPLVSKLPTSSRKKLNSCHSDNPMRHQYTRRTNGSLILKSSDSVRYVQAVRNWVHKLLFLALWITQFTGNVQASNFLDSACDGVHILYFTLRVKLCIEYHI